MQTVIKKQYQILIETTPNIFILFNPTESMMLCRCYFLFCSEDYQNILLHRRDWIIYSEDLVRSLEKTL